ncbi:MAG: tetratricopeptide (TPR) repeat protein [Paracoccaceae bacterium]|jgi:tetratricopeptide (TPR) repeat protein
MKHIPLIAALMCAAAPAFANSETCPAAAIDENRRAALMAQVRVAPNAMEARLITNQLWEMWATAPDAHAQEMLDLGMERRRISDLDKAIRSFDAVIAYCPDYAEGYNQRAFVRFMRQDYIGALEDLEAAIARSPEHIAAITGKALTLIGLERDVEAQILLREALKMNPWLSERRFLTPLQGNPL